MRYVAFLRGVNVGGRTIKMAELRACFEGIGLREVTTVLQSGNVIFEAARATPPALKQKIEGALAATFAYPARVHVLALAEVHAIAAACPYADDDPDRHAYVVFLENGLETALAGEAVALAPGEETQVGRGVVYWRCPRGSTLQSAFGKLLTRARYRDFNTNRNLRTLRRLG